MTEYGPQDDAEWAASADRDAEEAAWVAAYRRLHPAPRTVANVRAASVAARSLALVVGVLVVLLAVVGAAYVWADSVPNPAPLKSDRGF